MKCSNSPMFLSMFLAANRTLSRTAQCPGWSPWLKLRRATFIPAAINFSSWGTSQHAGPIVQTILDRRNLGSDLFRIVSRSMRPPAKIGTCDEWEMDMFEWLIKFASCYLREATRWERDKGPKALARSFFALLQSIVVCCPSSWTADVCRRRSWRARINNDG